MEIAGNEPAIMLITEVIPKAQVQPIDPARLMIPGYKMYASFNPLDSELGSSGQRGICVYIADALQCCEVSFPKSKFSEQLWTRIKLEGGDSVLVGCLYRSPSSSDDSIHHFRELLQLVMATNPSHLLLAGDFNLGDIDWLKHMSRAPPSHISHAFIEITDDFFLHQHVTFPTRFRHGNTPSVLDLIFTNEEGMVRNLCSGPGLGKSDHVVLRFSLVGYSPQENTAASKLALNRGDYARLTELACQASWTGPSDPGIDVQYEAFKAKLDHITKQCVPYQKPRRRMRNIYTTREAAALSKKKRRLWHAYTRSGSILDHARFVRVRNNLRRLTRQLRKDFEANLALRMKSNVKPFWRYTNSKLKTRSHIEDLKRPDGSTANTDAEKAQMLSSYFSSVFCQDEDSTDIPSLNTDYGGPVLEDVVIAPLLVQNKLKSLKPSSSPGPDQIHPRVLTELAAPLSKPLSDLYRLSLDQGQLPEDWKVGQVVPIFKKGKKDDASNYRPVSLTSVICKVMESIIRDQLLEHLLASGQLSDAQHGFVPRRSCVTQLLATMEDWTMLLETGEPVDVIYTDFRKAFDSVPHRRLLSKLHSYGIRGKLLRWLEAFLMRRKQRVVINGTFSSWSDVTSGIPQGSVLGPVLFTVYVNDLPGEVTSTVKLFADDMKMYRGIGTGIGHDSLQTDLDRLVTWSVKWMLPLNVAKCSTLHLGSSNPCEPYTVQGSHLQETRVECDLGVRIDDQLKFREQAAAAASRANRILGLIRHSFCHLDRTTLPILYKTIVRPLLEYGNQVWGPFNMSDKKLLERVQRRATKLVPEIRHHPYQERLRLLKLPSLQYRRRRGDMITMYNIMQGHVGLDKECLFSEPRTTRTRGHPFKVAKLQSTSRVRANHFSSRIVNYWNALPAEVVCAPSVDTFKKRLDEHWTDFFYEAPV